MDILTRIDPQYLKLVEKTIADTPADMHTLPADQLRNLRNGLRLVPPVPDGIDVEDTKVEAVGRDIPVRIYRKSDHANDQRPLIIYFHGGGFVIGNLDSHQISCVRLCEDTGWPVVSVDYRLAPEHPFPAAPEDCFSALCWAAENADTIGADTSRIAVVGESAGGNLAAATALLTRDRKGPAVGFQLLFYPVIDTDFTTPSYQDFAAGPLLPERLMRAYWRHYLGGAETTDDAYAAPLRAATLADLPPAAIATAEVDVLRSEAEAYGTRLKTFDIKVSDHRAAGLIHGFMKHVNVHPEANRVYSAARDDMVTALSS
jgi:acetyl esterase